MKVEGPQGARPAGPARAARRAAPSSGAFADLIAEDHAASAPAPTAAAAPARAVSPLMALQEVEDPAVGRRKARRRGHALLDRLEELRHGLLAGALSGAALRELAQLAAEQRPYVDDPGLAAVLDEIDLRVQVELAKLEMSGVGGTIV